MDERRTYLEGSERILQRPAADTAGEGKENRIAEGVKEHAHEAAARARDEVEGQYNEQRTAVVQELESIERALQQAAKSLDQEGRQATAGHMRSLAHTLGRLTQEVRGKSLSGLIATVDDYGRREPALVFAGAAAAGFALTRFFKSSAPEQAEQGPTFSPLGAGEGGATW